MVARARMGAPFLLYVFLFALTSSGCSVWRPQGFAPAVVVRGERPERLRAYLNDGTIVEVRSPVVIGDSLSCTLPSGPRTIALSDIDHVALSRRNPVGVVLATEVIVAVVFFGLAGLALASSSGYD